MFSDADQKLIVLLAAHAAIAIENARLHERSRELSDHRGAQPARARAARLGHPAAVRRRAGGRVGVDAAGARPRRRRGGARAGLRARARRDGGAARGRLRAAAGIARGRGARDRAAQARRGAAAGVRASDRAARARRAAPRRAGSAAQVLRIAQEALGNALRHAAARAHHVKLESGGGALVLSVSDDGCGFDPAGPEVRGQRLGLTSMEERATELGGDADASTRRSGRAPRCAWRCPHDPRPARRRPRGRAPGPAHVPRPPGRHRGRRRGRRRRGRASTPPPAPTRT